MRARQGAGGPDMGMLMLVMQVARIGVDQIGPVTMALLGINAALFYYDFSELGVPTALGDVCIGAPHIWFGGQYSRLLWATLFHSSSMHLYYNMSSLLLKGRLLEPVMGTLQFAWLVLSFALCSSALMVAATVALDPIMPQYHLMNTCAVGFSVRRESNAMPDDRAVTCVVSGRFVRAQHCAAVCDCASRAELRVGLQRAHQIRHAGRAGAYLLHRAQRVLSRVTSRCHQSLVVQCVIIAF